MQWNNVLSREWPKHPFSTRPNAVIRMRDMKFLPFLSPHDLVLPVMYAVPDMCAAKICVVIMCCKKRCRMHTRVEKESDRVVAV